MADRIEAGFSLNNRPIVAKVGLLWKTVSLAFYQCFPSTMKHFKFLIFWKKVIVKYSLVH